MINNSINYYTVKYFNNIELIIMHLIFYSV